MISSISDIRSTTLRRAAIIAYMPMLIVLTAFCNLGIWIVDDILELDELFARARKSWRRRP